MERRKTLPKYGKKLGTVKEDGKDYHVYNIGGEATVCVMSKPLKKYNCFKSNYMTAHMLRKLELEPNAGGGLFVPRGFRKAKRRKTFRGMTRKQIRDAQKKY